MGADVCFFVVKDCREHDDMIAPDVTHNVIWALFSVPQCGQTMKETLWHGCTECIVYYCRECETNLN